MENIESQIIQTSRQKQEQFDEIETTNEMQRKLAVIIHPEKTDDDAMFTFATSDEHIRFRKLVDDFPELVQQYKTNPVEILQTIREKINQNTYH